MVCSVGTASVEDKANTMAYSGGRPLRPFEGSLAAWVNSPLSCDATPTEAIRDL